MKVKKAKDYYLREKFKNHNIYKNRMDDIAVAHSLLI